MRNKKVKRIEIEGHPAHYIEVSVSYSGRPEYCGAAKQGYYLHVQPLINKGDGVISFLGYTGYKVRLEEATRYSAKRLDTLAATVLDTDQCKQMIEQVRVEELERIASGEAATA